ncbi:unnamed protein product, partial [Lepidochelys olivacea]
MHVKHIPFFWLLMIDRKQLRNDPLTERNQVQKFIWVSPHYNSDSLIFDHKKGFWCLPLKEGKIKCVEEAKEQKYPSINLK